MLALGAVLLIISLRTWITVLGTALSVWAFAYLYNDNWPIYVAVLVGIAGVSLSLFLQYKWSDNGREKSFSVAVLMLVGALIGVGLFFLGLPDWLPAGLTRSERAKMSLDVIMILMLTIIFFPFRKLPGKVTDFFKGVRNIPNRLSDLWDDICDLKDLRPWHIPEGLFAIISGALIFWGLGMLVRHYAPSSWVLYIPIMGLLGLWTTALLTMLSRLGDWKEWKLIESVSAGVLSLGIVIFSMWCTLLYHRFVDLGSIDLFSFVIAWAMVGLDVVVSWVGKGFVSVLLVAIFYMLKLIGIPWLVCQIGRLIYELVHQKEDLPRSSYEWVHALVMSPIMGWWIGSFLRSSAADYGIGAYFFPFIALYFYFRATMYRKRCGKCGSSEVYVNQHVNYGEKVQTGSTTTTETIKLDGEVIDEKRTVDRHYRQDDFVERYCKCGRCGHLWTEHYWNTTRWTE